MGNIISYIDWRGDLSFSQDPFNEVDSLVFSTLAYLDMEGLAPTTFEKSVTLCQLKAQYDAAGIDQRDLFFDPSVLLRKLFSTTRFKDVEVCGFENIIDEQRETQFCACVFLIPDGSAYVAFRGTDNSIVGWKEDGNFAFSGATEGQKRAADYVSRAAKALDCPMMVGGHSKGGNFAMYGAAFADEFAKSLIRQVYSHDGPGFNDTIIATDEYRAVLKKTELIIPEESLIGMLLTNKQKKTFIRSIQHGIGQHDVYTWQLTGKRFDRAEGRSLTGERMDKTVVEMVSQLSEDQKRNILSAVFDALEASGAKTLTEINRNKWLSYNAILKALKNTESEKANDIVEMVKTFATLSRDVMFDEAKNTIEKVAETAEAQRKKTISLFHRHREKKEKKAKKRFPFLPGGKKEKKESV